MPVILDPAEYAVWLDPENRDPEALARMLHPSPADELEAVPVSRGVCSPKNDDAALLDPVEIGSEGAA